MPDACGKHATSMQNGCSRYAPSPAPAPAPTPKPKDKGANAGAFDASRFDAFWEHFPNKRGKQKALEAFRKLNPDDLLLAKMIKAVEEQTEWRKRMSAASQWVEPWKYGQGWINGRRWEDELPEPAGVAATEYAELA